MPLFGGCQTQTFTMATALQANNNNTNHELVMASVILEKYKDKEAELNQKLTAHVEETVHKQTEYRKNKREARVVQMTEAIKRNKQILNDLESVKGALRSKAIYSPSEMQWGEVCKKYQEAPALPVSRWRCHLPVFV